MDGIDHTDRNSRAGPWRDRLDWQRGEVDATEAFAVNVRDGKVVTLLATTFG